MKTPLFITFNILFLTFLLVSTSCSTGKKQESVKQPKMDTLVLDTTASTIKWVREAENKVENKQVKIWGVTANVNMENVSFTTDGNIQPLEGILIQKNDTIINWQILADFMMVRLFSEKSNQAISTEKFPPTLLIINKINQDTTGSRWSMIGLLTIKETTKEVTLTGNVKKDNGKQKIEAKLKIQTLDFPIRENVKKENVIKDEITFDFNLIFGTKSVSEIKQLVKGN